LENVDLAPSFLENVGAQQVATEMYDFIEKIYYIIVSVSSSGFLNLKSKVTNSWFVTLYLFSLWFNFIYEFYAADRWQVIFRPKLFVNQHFIFYKIHKFDPFDSLIP
jgi:hypothetical protein